MIGAAHAGWRGALAGVVEATHRRDGAARRPSASRIPAAVGPCIARRSYEVDEAFRRRFAEPIRTMSASSPPAAPGKPSSTSKPMSSPASPPRASSRVEALGLDTYAEPDRFFSFRRATHRGEPDYGRQISALIAIAGLGELVQLGVNPSG